MKKKIVFDLDPYEQSIEDQIETFVPASAETRTRFSTIVEKARKNRSVNLRFDGNDLDRVKQKAGESGLPYQTFITMILHKYVTDQFVDIKEAKKLLRYAR
ncbi:antitoxin BrnA [Candidatus Termititenax aidoneus]|uniref:Antitoxin BrnA n=1 Tax=Termititenax aidoneus TaxID=2218524 RepID=A0A388TED1_TERA1|nr:antitoxin BrnA [Candidatus Termititenax aidoneus]